MKNRVLSPAIKVTTWAVAAMLAYPLSTPISVLAAPHSPAKGTAERTAIMKALHGVLGVGKHTPLVTATHCKVDKGWAFVEGGFVYADGAPLEERFTEGSATHFSALLHREGKSWRVKRRLYHGDVVVPLFMHDFPQAPRAIFQ